jgi:hypothetical protein
MITLAIVLLLAGALFGLYMATRIFRNTLPPVIAAALHGLLAGAGLVLALYTAWADAAGGAQWTGVGLLVLAALGGVFLVSFHFRRKTGPKPVVVLHAAVAVCGVGVLIANAAGLI